MRWSAAVLFAAVIAAAPAPARAGMSLGANLGLAFVNPDPGGDVTIFAFPNQRTTPGLRLGWAGKSAASEIFLDLGYSYVGVEEASSSEALATANLQYNFSASQPLSFYVTAGGGVVRETAKSAKDVPSPYDLSAMSSVFGGGLGVRRRVAGGHGTLRSEIRYDLVTEGRDGSTLIVAKGGVLQLKLGFDVWN